MTSQYATKIVGRLWEIDYLDKQEAAQGFYTMSVVFAYIRKGLNSKLIITLDASFP